jgi:hypothetical protein|tara:strand:- start:296 stop:796 length:501 start_codon:yes stop_codon:yes gene_type:complete
MRERVFLKSYCLIGLGDIENIKEDLSYISENNTQFVSGESLILCTFQSAFHIVELEEFFNMNQRSYIVFEMLPGAFSANLTNTQFQNALFGGMIDNSKYDNIYNISEGIKEFMETIKEDLIEDAIITPVKTELTLNVDDILDKIADVGMDNLSLEEKEYLDNYSKK